MNWRLAWPGTLSGEPPMNILLIIGRLAFVAIFVLSGAQKLMDIGATAAMIAPKVVVPAELASFADST